MPRKGTYYFARVIKGGQVSNDTIIAALQRPKPIEYHGFAWTFSRFRPGPDRQWFYARLTKYRRDGTVTVLDENKGSDVEQIAPNLIVAASPFIFVPAHSGLVYLHVWNQIEQRTFPRRFASLIVEAHDRVFALCDVEAIADLRTFFKKLASLERIEHLSVKVSPPNPLFGPLWKELRDYIAERNAKTFKIEENGLEGGLNTPLRQMAADIEFHEASQVLDDDPSTSLPLADAAMLMAVDGYGSGTVKGKLDGRSFVIHTSQTQVNMTHDADPAPYELAQSALAMLERLARERDLRHGK